MPKLIYKCPECGKNKFWKLNDGRLRRVSCHHRFSLKNSVLKINRKLLRKIVQEFILGHSVNIILGRANISKRKLLKISTLLRIAMTKDAPDVFEGYVHRTAKHSHNEYSDKKGNYINGLEGFWGYLKRKLKAKGGIIKTRMSLYVGEYVWRHNHRCLDFKEQENRFKDCLLFSRNCGKIKDNNLYPKQLSASDIKSDYLTIFGPIFETLPNFVDLVNNYFSTL